MAPACAPRLDGEGRELPVAKPQTFQRTGIAADGVTIAPVGRPLPPASGVEAGAFVAIAGNLGELDTIAATRLGFG